MLRIAERLIGFGHLFEQLFPLLFARIPVRVVLHRQAVVGLLDPRPSRRWIDPEDLVIIAIAPFSEHVERHFDLHSHLEAPTVQGQVSFSFP